MRRTTIITLVFTALIASGVLFQMISDEGSRDIGRRLESFIATPARLFATLFDQTPTAQTLEALRSENELLKARVVLLSEHQSISEKPYTVDAHIFSTYPFNHRNRLRIDAGEYDGVFVGSGVGVAGVFLLGQVTEVFPYTSTVRTIFDTEVNLPVKIGASGIDALLVGGRTPRLTLIVRDAKVAAGDEVYSVDTHFPYGLTVGNVDTIRIDSGGAFQEATLRIPYDLGALTNATVFLL